MRKLVILLAFVATATIFASCTSYTCPTYSLEQTQETPTKLAKQNL